MQGANKERWKVLCEQAATDQRCPCCLRATRYRPRRIRVLGAWRRIRCPIFREGRFLPY
jgi:hypothetical protein